MPQEHTRRAAPARLVRLVCARVGISRPSQRRRQRWAEVGRGTGGIHQRQLRQGSGATAGAGRGGRNGGCPEPERPSRPDRRLFGGRHSARARRRRERLRPAPSLTWIDAVTGPCRRFLRGPDVQRDKRFWRPLGWYSYLAWFMQGAKVQASRFTPAAGTRAVFR